MKLSNTETLLLVEELAQKIKGRQYSSIYPVPRGGYRIGIQLGDILGLPLVLDEDEITKDTLIVDDLIDSGKTLSQYNNDKAVLFVKNNKEHLVDFYVKKLTQNEWIQFPDEKDEEELEHLERLLQFIGIDTSKEDLKSRFNDITSAIKNVLNKEHNQ